MEVYLINIIIMKTQTDQNKNLCVTHTNVGGTGVDAL